MSCIKIVERREDMSPLGKLRLIVQQDGDILIAVIPDPDQPLGMMDSVEFCSCGGGGGRSRHTMQALRALVAAMELDNIETPSGKPEL